MTAQSPDIIILDGHPFDLHNCPLERYFKITGWHPEFSIMSTANYRGYVARWEIFDLRLFLTGLFGSDWIIPDHLRGKLQPDPDPFEDRGNEEKSLRLVDLFPDQAPLVEAAWVKERLVIPTGPRLVYKHFGLESLHASYRLINVVEGKIRSVRDLDGREWARRTRRHWPDQDWLAENPEALVWLEDEQNQEEENEQLPDWRLEESPSLRRLYYERSQIEALERPCGQRPVSSVALQPSGRPTWDRLCYPSAP